MVNVDQQHNLPTQTQNKADNVHIYLTLRCGYVSFVDVKKQKVLWFLSMCL